MTRTLLLTAALLLACGGQSVTVGGNGGGSGTHDGGTGGSTGTGGAGSSATGGGTGVGGGSTGTGGGSSGTGGGTGSCSTNPNGCYAVYAHGNHTLYSIDLSTKALQTIGPFNAPMVGGSEDTITDLAVAPDNTIYVVSHTALYTASATDGHVTRLGSLGLCGQDNVALTFTPDGTLYVADFKGALCTIDYHVSPPTVISLGSLSGGYAISGDLVAVDDGTIFGSAYLLADAANTGTQANNTIIKLDPTTRTVTPIGPSGFPKLFGLSYALGQIFGFTHDGTGRVVTIDPHTGVGTVFNTFKDPATNTNISFAGAGVNSLVTPTIN